MPSGKVAIHFWMMIFWSFSSLLADSIHLGETVFFAAMLFAGFLGST